MPTQIDDADLLVQVDGEQMVIVATDGGRETTVRLTISQAHQLAMLVRHGIDIIEKRIMDRHVQGG